MSGSRLLDSGGRVKVRTSMLNTGVTALSVLSIDKVDQSDRGNYTCKPASGGEASISLHVLEGKPLMKFDEILFMASLIFLLPPCLIWLRGTIGLFDILLFSGEKPAGLHHDQTSDSNQFKTHLGTEQTMTFFQYPFPRFFN
jgi:hypothetical protein